MNKQPKQQWRSHGSSHAAAVKAGIARVKAKREQERLAKSTAVAHQQIGTKLHTATAAVLQTLADLPEKERKIVLEVCALIFHYP